MAALETRGTKLSTACRRVERAVPGLHVGKCKRNVLVVLGYLFVLITVGAWVW